MNSEQRMQRLAPQVTRYARTVSRNANLPADEIEQEMWVTILTHGHRYPSDKNLLVKAALDAKSKLLRDNNPRRRTARYLPQTIKVIPDYSDELDNEGSQELPICDINAVGTEETALRQVSIDLTTSLRSNIQQCVRSLDDQRRQVAELLMAGYRPSEIAAEMAITRPAVSYHIRKLRGTLSPYQSLCAVM
jgi:RNA polymerase sigma factor (sigma-70 family)